MRRTYRSKKDTTGALDPKDVLLTMDEKSSAFDAFYIQNIKQTKREMSCMGSTNQYGVAASKVRKKKFVKRIHKEVEPSVKNAMSMSTYLTPDKSIRVNKAPDLFDQLLNSTTVNHDISTKNQNTFDRLRYNIPKRYSKKKVYKTKKINYSSSSEDSGKENLDQTNNTTSNTSDIKHHELLIEKVSTSPKTQDESINNIVKNISLLNHIRNKSITSNGSLKKVIKNKHRLTEKILSPNHTNSPQCSTPFLKKYRGKSIYNFSPIAMGELDDSPKYVTITEENNESVFKDVTKESITEEVPMSPIIHVPSMSKSMKDKTKNISIPISYLAHIPDNQNEVSRPIDVEEKGNDDNVTVANEIYEKCDSIAEVVQNLGDASNLEFSTEIGSIQASELEPLYGFASNELANTSRQEQDYSNNSVISVKSNMKKDISVLESVVIDDTLPTEPFLGFTKVEDKEEVSSDDSGQSVSSFNSVDSDKESGKSGSFYDCNSETSEGRMIAKEPLVRLQRMNDESFKKYYQVMPNYDSSEESDVENLNSSNDGEVNNTSESETSENLNTEDCVNDSLPNKSDSNRNIDVTALTFENKDSNKNDLNINEVIDQTVLNESGDDAKDTTTYYVASDDDKNIQEVESSGSNTNSEERCFVTTRRRNDYTRESSMLICKSDSDSQSDCDRTVVSKKYNSPSSDAGTSDKQTNDDEGISKDEDINDKASFITTRQSFKDRNTLVPKVSEENNLEKADYRTSFVSTRISKARFSTTLDNTCTEERPAIILQPGKKWERSLSIYRRMSMMTDNFDSSILDNESLNSKGRKYRQSVIHTMEMQHGPLHNDSINSRRSTFVSKPNRSTIRILKEPNDSRLSLCNSTVFDDLNGFLAEDCDDTIVELSKLSIADSDHEITVLGEVHDTSHRNITARDYVLRRCNQTDTILFDECYPDAVLKNCHKIGEGVYGEVFLWRATDGRARVMKIVPIAGDIKVNGEQQKDFHEIISEVVIAMELSALRAPIANIERLLDEGTEVEALDLHSIENATDVFNEVLAVRCVYGPYPSRLLDLWDLYDECKGSENDNPAILPPDQQYIVLELANAGQDLESYQFNNAEQAYALFLQVAYGLAVGEEAFQFEHRDLHWGNVLIAPTEQKYATFVIRGRAVRVLRRGVAATVIDYSLSRVSLSLAAGGAAGGAAAALYNDLAHDDALFDAVGDYQFHVYRLMRERTQNDWKAYEPYTNILWLHYTVDKMITALRYKRSNTKIHKHYLGKLGALKERLLDYGSAAHFVLNDPELNN